MLQNEPCLHSGRWGVKEFWGKILRILSKIAEIWKNCINLKYFYFLLVLTYGCIVNIINYQDRHLKHTIFIFFAILGGKNTDFCENQWKPQHFSNIAIFVIQNELSCFGMVLGMNNPSFQFSVCMLNIFGKKKILLKEETLITTHH